MRVKGPGRVLVSGSEGFFEINLAGDGDLVGRDAAFEEAGELLDVLDSMNGNGLLAP